MSDKEGNNDTQSAEKHHADGKSTDDVENQEIDVETDAREMKDDNDVTQTAAQELSSAPPASAMRKIKNKPLSPSQIKVEPTTDMESNRPNTANSFSSGTSADSIPPQPPIATTQSRKLPLQRPCVISSLTDNPFTATYLVSSSKMDPIRSLQKPILCKANSDSRVYFKNNSMLSSDRDSQVIGVTSEHHLGPLCVIRRKIKFDTDDAFVKTFQLYWYVDASKGCLESPILSTNIKRLHGNSLIETPYFVITKNQRRHQAYSCTFCKGKTTFISIIQALRHLKANHRHDVRIIIQDPNGVFNTDSTRCSGSNNQYNQKCISTVPLQLPWSLPPRPIAPFTSTGGLSIRSLDIRHREVSRTPSEIPPDAIEDTTQLTQENIVYLKDILSRKLDKQVMECTPRGGAEVTVVFNDNTSRIVKLANENQANEQRLRSPPRFENNHDQPNRIPKHKALLRTVSESVGRGSTDHHNSLPRDSLKRTRLDHSSFTSAANEYYQAPSKSKYAAKMEYINQMNKIDAAKTISYMYKPSFPKSDTNEETDDYLADGEMSQHSKMEKFDSRSHKSDSTCTIDIDRDSNAIDDKFKVENEDSPSLHGKSLVNENSPLLVIRDYSSGIIADQSTFKLKVQKQKLDPKKINISVSEGTVKMDVATKNQYYDSYAKVQVLTTSFRCKICDHITHTENAMSDHITEHSLKQLMSFH